MFVISSLRPGYVEQRDMHMPLATVRESLLFSATLRLPRSVTEEQRRAFVEEIIDILELRPLADRIVGNGQQTSSVMQMRMPRTWRLRLRGLTQPFYGFMFLSACVQRNTPV